LPIGASFPSTEISGAGSTPVVLVVDDEERNRALMRAFLGGEYEVREAEDGPSALAVLAKGGIDLVILDVMMPGSSGFDVCREIKSAANDEVLPVLLVTALSDATDRHQGLLAGADDFLSKPVDRQELMLRVRNFLHLRKQHQLLHQQYEALQELVALKDDLVTLMVHDLRNPLTGVLGMLQVLQLDIEDPLRQADAENARQAGEKMRETLDDLLQVRLLEEGRVALRRERIWLQEVVRSASESLEGMARMRNLHISHAVDGRLTLHADAALVRRAVENLLSNAIKFSPVGQTIEVVGSNVGSLVSIEVADRGTGVAPERRPQLFEKFGGVRVQRPSDRRGYGLGLYLVKLVADAHGGSVAVRDREGGGTLLCLSLPEGPGAAG
jgi:two-component system, sensor histidine kinase and response regulator